MENKRNKDAIIIILLVVLLLTVIGGLVWYYISQNNTNKVEILQNNDELIAKDAEINSLKGEVELKNTQINSLKSEVEIKNKEIASLKKGKEQLSQKVETNSNSKVETVNGLISDMKLEKTFFYQQGNAVGNAKSMTIRLPQLNTNNKAATTFNNEVKKIYEDKVKEYNNESKYLYSRAITYTFNYEQDYLTIYIIEVTEENYGRSGSPDNQTIKYSARYSLDTKELVLNEGKVWEKISYNQY